VGASSKYLCAVEGVNATGLQTYELSAQHLNQENDNFERLKKHKIIFSLRKIASNNQRFK